MFKSLSEQIDDALANLTILELRIGHARQSGTMLTKEKLFEYLMAWANYRNFFALSHYRHESKWSGIILDCQAKIMTQQLKDFLKEIKDNLEARIPPTERIVLGYKPIDVLHPLPAAISVSNILVENEKLFTTLPLLLLALIEISDSNT